MMTKKESNSLPPKKEIKTMKFEFGDIVQDLITKTEGIVTGHADYVTGCDQYLIQPKSDKRNIKISGEWFDEMRLVKKGIDKATRSIIKTNTGADIEAPQK